VRQPHGGQARSQNTALRLVRGDYLFKMDDDDLARPNLLATCAAGLDVRPDHWAVNFKRNVFSGSHKDGWKFYKYNFGTPLFFRVSALRALQGWKECYVMLEDAELQLRGSFQRCWLEWRCETPLYDYRVSRATNSRFRVDDMALFCHRYIMDHNWVLAAWGVLFDPPELQTLQQAAGDFSGSHRRNGLLPSARFAHWQEAVPEHLLKKIEKTARLTALRPLPPDAPLVQWKHLWKREREVWAYLRCMRVPLRWRTAVVWLVARNYYDRRKRRQQLRTDMMQGKQ